MYPDDLKYSEKHLWCKKLNGTVEVGYSHYAQDRLGDIIYIELPEVGSEIKKGERIGMVESSKAVSDINSPVSGKITEVNTSVEDAPEEINNDCYGTGWIARIELSDPSEIDGLMSADQYQEQL